MKCGARYFGTTLFYIIGKFLQSHKKRDPSDIQLLHNDKTGVFSHDNSYFSCFLFFLSV